MVDTVTNPLALSDEEFMALPMDSYPPAEAPVTETTEAPVAEATGAEVVSEPTPEAEPQAEVLPEGDANAEAPKVEGEADPAKPNGEEGADAGDIPAKAKEEPKAGEPEAAKPEGTVPPVGSEAEPQGDAPKGEQPQSAASSEPIDYEAAYKKIVAPIKAAGRTLEIRSPEEAIKLMQQGAHFTQKMQSIQPHRKVLTMLENNELLDAGKLDFLIAVSKGEPEAIKKLIKDSGIDPLEIDTQSDPQYRGGSHIVGDDELNFKAALDDLVSTPEGEESLKLFNTTFDDASKDAVWGNPSLMNDLHHQRQIGVYDAIADEVHRRRTLGSIAPNMPFIKAYEVVGAELHTSGALNDIILKAAPNPEPTKTEVAPQIQAPVPVATRAVVPTKADPNDTKVSAAAPTRTSPRPAKAFINPLEMSDADFLNEFGPRLNSR